MLERHLGHHLRDLFQCPGAAGERNESIPQLDHLRLALRHVLRDDQIGQAVVLQLSLHEELRLHAGHLAARCEDTVGQHPHQAAAGAAIDQRVSALPDPFAQFLHRRFQCRVRSLVCPKINCNVHRFSFLRMESYKKGAILLKRTAPSEAYETIRC